jgi:UDP-4-amino-4,6-dideoxy-N-acetyl-beta-L-altrosamine transaminase/dTDP-4-dehydrorhamnose reductase
MKNRILFTGGSGLLAINWALSITDRYDVILGLHERIVSVPGIEARKINIESSDAFKICLADIQPDIVVHCAGLTNIEACEQDPSLAYHINVELSANVARACAAAQIRLVLISTDHLFSGDTSLVSEDEPVRPVNVYAKTKWEAEQAVLTNCPGSLVIRTNFYGWGTDYRHSFSDFIITSLRSKRSISLFTDFYYTPILITELSETVMQLLAVNASGIFNVAGNERLSKYEFGIHLANHFGLDASLISKMSLSDRKDLVKRPADMSLSNEKAAKFLNKKFLSNYDSLTNLKREEEAGRSTVLSHSPIIPYGRQDISEEDIHAVVEVLRSDWLTQGPVVPAFEKAVASYCSAGYGVAVNSATSALHIACLALGVGKGDRVWTSPVTFVASANCALYCGASVDFVDIDTRTYNMSVEALRLKLVKAKKEDRLPKVVIPVHLSGQVCEMEAIHLLGQQYGFKIIEDASHAIGGKYKNQPVGNCRYSDITIFSFHPVKIITTGEGGMAVTNEHKLALRMAHLRSHGVVRHGDELIKVPDGPWYYEQVYLGFNYRMTDIHAALGLSQMKRLDEFVSGRHEIAERYNEILTAPWLTLPYQHKDSYSGMHLYIIRVQKGNTTIDRLRLFENLRTAGILVNLHYIPVYRHPYYRAMGFDPADFPNAESYYEEAISIPMYASLTREQQDFVAATISEQTPPDFDAGQPGGFQNIF